MKTQKLEKKQFKKFYGNVYYFYRFEKYKRDFEICLEPCDNGFDIAIYERFGTDGFYKRVKRECLFENGYSLDELHETERREDTWTHALQVAAEMMVTL